MRWRRRVVDETWGVGQEVAVGIVYGYGVGVWELRG